MIRGLDVSICQGAPPWAALKAAGIEYVSIRCGVGNDPKDVDFDTNVAAARAAGLVVQAYHFLYPLAHIDPEQCAENHFVMAGGVGMQENTLPAAFDLEWPPRETLAPDHKTILDTWGKWGCTKDQINAWFVKYAARYEMLQLRKGVIYIYPYYLQCLQPVPQAVYDLTCWWASNWKTGQVPQDGDKPINPMPAVWSGKPYFWQHDGNGGILMPNGRDADFDCFIGTREQFNALALRGTGVGSAST